MNESNSFDAAAPEGDVSGGGQYVTKRDLRVMIGGSILLLLLLYPIYRLMKANSEKTICGTNLGQIYKAVSMYSLDHDDRFPPIYATNEDNQPYIDKSGVPYTWISDVSQQMSARASFVCPSSDPLEQTVQQSKDSGVFIHSSYGMYTPYGGVARFDVENPDSTVLIVETSNHGSKGSFDPEPLKGQYDGFSAAWSNSNFTPSSKSESISRLAFRNTANGKFGEDGSSRHPSGIHMVTIAGEKLLRTPPAALVQIRDGWPSGLWTVPLSGRKR